MNVSDDGNHFILDEPKLASVLSKVPPSPCVPAALCGVAAEQANALCVVGA